MQRGATAPVTVPMNPAVCSKCWVVIIIIEVYRGSSKRAGGQFTFNSVYSKCEQTLEFICQRWHIHSQLFAVGEDIFLMPKVFKYLNSEENVQSILNGREL